jgi:AcrR family transcriptional regulator
MNIHSVPVDAALSPMTTRVLDAALAVFTERTYGGAAVPQVAERAGIGVGTIYRSFAGKEELANGVYRRAKRGMLDHLVAALTALPADASSRRRVAAVWSGLAAYAVADPDGFAFLEHQQHASYLDDESVALGRRIDAFAEDLVRDGQRAGDLRDGDPAMLVALVFGAFVGLSKQRRSGGLPLTSSDVEAAGDAVWHLVARPPTPTKKDRS